MNTITQLIGVLTLLIIPCLAAGKPIIGINIDVKGLEADGALSLGSSYVDAVTSAGGLPIILPPVLDDTAIPRYLELCDGFLMSGGRDINPLRYGATTITEHVNLVNPRRENFDMALIDAALAAKKPILGVCLGSQELNIATGGSLFQDLPTETSSTIAHKPGTSEVSHSVDITTGTMLHDMVGTTTLMVNSIHHQACDRIGSGVLVMAKAPDGIVEAFSLENQDFAVGIQWHPEQLTEIPEQLKIYQALIEAAQRARDNRLK